jgi:hypothetical protein
MYSTKILSKPLLAGWLGLMTGLLGAVAGPVVLEGDMLRVGVNTSGVLVDNNYTAGISFRESPATPWQLDGPDFLTPNGAFEFYGLGHAGAEGLGGYFNWSGAATTDLSDGTLRKTFTVGTLGDLRFEQTLSFQADESVISFSVRLINQGASTLNDVFYARGLDANPDYFLGADATTFATHNVIESPNRVTSWGPETGWAISIFSNSALPSTPSVRSDWSSAFQPSSLLVASDAGFGDHSINMAWQIGSLAPGAEATVDFEYRIHRIVPGVPDGTSTLALVLLPLVGLLWVRRRRVS